MKKEIRISIVGIRTERGGEPEKIEFETEGKYYIKDTTHYIVYEESELTGYKGTTTTIKVSKDEVTLARFGTNNTQMMFKKGRQYRGYYETPYGNFGMCITPTKVDINIGEDGGKINLEYLLDFARSSSKNTFNIKFSI